MELPLTRPYEVDRDWRHDTVVLVGSGYSLTDEDAEYIQAKRVWRILAVSDAYKKFRWVDMLYSTDAKWWRFHYENLLNWDVNRHFLFVTCSFPADSLMRSRAYTRDAVFELEGKDKPGLSKDKRVLHYGMTSGFAALNLAVLTGTKRIILVGFDYNKGPNGESHFFGDHPAKIYTPFPYALAVKKFEEVTGELKEMGVEVYRTNLGSALTMFPYQDLRSL